MTTTVFTNTVTLTDADWFNDGNRIVYDILDDAATKAAARTALAVIGTAGGNLTGGVNEARGNITQHATTMDFFATTSPNILDGTGSAVTITACVNAPQSGATRKFYPLLNTILTHGATFDINGNVNLTAATGDCWVIETKAGSVNTYRAYPIREDGLPVASEYSTVAFGAAIGAITSSTAVNVTSLSLSPGDWDVSGIIKWGTNGSSITGFSNLSSSLSSTSNTSGTDVAAHVAPGGSASYSDASAGSYQQPAPITRFNLSATTTIYLVALAFFTAGAGSLNPSGTIKARRVR